MQIIDQSGHVEKVKKRKEKASVKAAQQRTEAEKKRLLAEKARIRKRLGELDE